jgi:hypothetical protein
MDGTAVELSNSVGKGLLSPALSSEGGEGEDFTISASIAWHGWKVAQRVRAIRRSWSLDAIFWRL